MIAIESRIVRMLFALVKWGARSQTPKTIAASTRSRLNSRARPTRATNRPKAEDGGTAGRRDGEWGNALTDHSLLHYRPRPRADPPPLRPSAPPPRRPAVPSPRT